MRGAAAPPPTNGHSSVTRNSHTSSNNNQDVLLEDLGFEEGELDMFFQLTDYTEHELIQRYLEIAQNPPYNLNWGSSRVAARATRTGVYKRNGIEYTKHDIAQDALTSFYDEAEGRAQGIRKKKRGTRRKHRSYKRKHTRRHRTRNKRRLH